MKCETGWDFYRWYWRPGMVVVGDMERNGMLLDPVACEEERSTTQAKVNVLEISLNEWAGQEIKWSSWKQKQQLLYGTSICPAVKGGAPITPMGFELPPVVGNHRAVKIRKPNQAATSEMAITWLLEHNEDKEQRAGLQLLLDWGEANKLLTFYNSLPGHVSSDGRIHPQLGAVTETGRLSCSNPNLQNQPPDVRRCFIAREGRVLLELDFDGLEWRILAHVLAHRYNDMSLVNDILAGIDPHSATVVRMAEMGVAFQQCRGVPVEQIKERFPKERGYGKILNYSTNYGKTGAGLGVQLTGEDGEPIGKKRGEALLAGFFAANPGIAQFHRDIVTYAQANGYVRSLLGRRRYIPQLQSHDRSEFEKGTRLAKNVIQNCATDIVHLAMMRACPVDHYELRHLGWFRPKLRELGLQMLVQVHDSLTFEVDEDKAEEAKKELSDAMSSALEGVKDFRCPLSVSGAYGKTWKDCK